MPGSAALKGLLHQTERSSGRLIPNEIGRLDGHPAGAKLAIGKSK